MTFADPFDPTGGAKLASRLGMNEESPKVTYPHLSKAPIVQVAAELRTEATTEWSKERLVGELAPFFDGFQQKDVLEHSAQFNITQTEVQSNKIAPIWRGLVFATPDGREAVHFRHDRFVITRLAPYPGWDEFIANLKDRWALHHHLSGRNPVSRFGMRFINRIALGSKPVDLDTVLRYGPKDYPNQPLLVGDFEHREVMAEPSETYAVQIIRKSANKVHNGAQTIDEFGVTVDIDAFALKQWSGTSAEMDQHLTQIRALKNHIFFGSITENVRLSLQ